jgi:hypothetical protein
VKDAVKATKSDVELLDALNKELVPPDLANDDGEVCAVEDIETEEDVAAATGDGEHLPVASTLTGWPEVPLPSVMPRPEGIALIPAGMGPPGWVLLQLSGLSLASMVEAPVHRVSGQRGKGSKRRAIRKRRRCQKNGGQNAAGCNGGKAGGVAACEHFRETGRRLDV